MQSTYTMLKRAFPATIPSGHYFPLLAVMKESGMSDRAVAHAIACYHNSQAIDYLHDVAHVLPHTKISPRKKQEIIEVLSPHGYREWQNEE